MKKAKLNKQQLLEIKKESLEKYVISGLRV